MLLEQMSDEDLIFLINSGSKLAEIALYKRYSEYSKHTAASYYKAFIDSGISKDEFYAVAFSKVHECLARTDAIGSAFYLYWKGMTKHAIYDYVRENSYKYGAKVFAGLSFDHKRYNDNDAIMLSDVLGENEYDSQILEAIKDCIEGRRKLLTNNEKIAAELMLLKEHSRQEIMEITNWSKGKVNYVCRKVMIKIQEFLKENYL